MTTLMLERLKVKGYKSIEKLNLELGPINVLIGANGAGKSNFVGLFKFLNQLVERKLQIAVAQGGGANQFLHYGRKYTDRINLELWFATGIQQANGYACSLVPTVEDSLVFAEEYTYFHNRKKHPNRPYRGQSSSAVTTETQLPDWEQTNQVAAYVLKSLRAWRLYHFHDTGESARVKQMGDIHDNMFLRPDASNLAAYLFLLREKYQAHYLNIVETVRMAAPFFGDFVLRPHPLNHEKIRLEWQEEIADTLFGPHALSDGTLRFVCLATLFLQPVEQLPNIIVLDEPELGLHPYAIALLAEMVKSVSEHTQVILATQSVTLVNQFSPEDIIVVDRIQGRSEFRRLDQENIVHWMDDYGLGDLWEKNVLGGRPAL